MEESLLLTPGDALVVVLRFIKERGWSKGQFIKWLHEAQRLDPNGFSAALIYRDLNLPTGNMQFFALLVQMNELRATGAITVEARVPHDVGALMEEVRLTRGLLESVAAGNERMAQKLSDMVYVEPPKAPKPPVA